MVLLKKRQDIVEQVVLDQDELEHINVLLGESFKKHVDQVDLLAENFKLFIRVLEIDDLRGEQAKVADAIFEEVLDVGDSIDRVGVENEIKHEIEHSFVDFGSHGVLISKGIDDGLYVGFRQLVLNDFNLLNSLEGFLVQIMRDPVQERQKEVTQKLLQLAILALFQV